MSAEESIQLNQGRRNNTVRNRVAIRASMVANNAVDATPQQQQQFFKEPSSGGSISSEFFSSPALEQQRSVSKFQQNRDFTPSKQFMQRINSDSPMATLPIASKNVAGKVVDDIHKKIVSLQGGNIDKYGKAYGMLESYLKGNTNVLKEFDSNKSMVANNEDFRIDFLLRNYAVISDAVSQYSTYSKSYSNPPESSITAIVRDYISSNSNILSQQMYEDPSMSVEFRELYASAIKADMERDLRLAKSINSSLLNNEQVLYAVELEKNKSLFSGIQLKAAHDTLNNVYDKHEELVKKYKEEITKLNEEKSKLKSELESAKFHNNLEILAVNERFNKLKTFHDSRESLVAEAEKNVSEYSALKARKKMNEEEKIKAEKALAEIKNKLEENEKKIEDYRVKVDNLQKSNSNFESNAKLAESLKDHAEKNYNATLKENEKLKSSNDNYKHENFVLSKDRGKLENDLATYIESDKKLRSEIEKLNSDVALKDKKISALETAELHEDSTLYSLIMTHAKNKNVEDLKKAVQQAIQEDEMFTQKDKTLKKFSNIFDTIQLSGFKKLHDSNMNSPWASYGFLFRVAAALSATGIIIGGTLTAIVAAVKIIQSLAGTNKKRDKEVVNDEEPEAKKQKK